MSQETFFQVARVLVLTVISFVGAIFLLPYFLKFLTKYKLGKQIRSSESAPIYARLHRKKSGIPTMGGVVVWGTTLLVTLLFFGLSQSFPGTFFEKLNFLSRSQTLLPLGALVASALLGLLDDILGILKIGPKGGGLNMRHKILLYTIVAAFGAWWFYWKLEWDLLRIPFVGDVFIGIWYIPVFLFVIVATAFSTNEADGVDGLAGGLLLVAFSALGVIAFSTGRYDLAAFCGVIVGSLLAFLWYNIWPAKVFLGDTGSMGLGVCLGIIAMLTNTALILPFIGFVLVMESGSVLVQVTSKKLLGKKIFLSTPIHHHFEAKGWPESQVTMRFWIISWVMAGIGIIIGLLG